jgi:HEPN domain-containing protein
MDNNFDKEKVINHRINSSDNAFKAMIDLFNTKNYNWALFMGHLVIEKLIKALFVNSKEDYPPIIHDLRRIYEKAGLEIDESQQILLYTISRFNINARYDDYKDSFYKLCTDSFTEELIEKIQECRIWIKTQL